MSDGQNAARHHFLRDLRRIREERGLSIEDIHEATQVAPSQVEAFETGELFEETRMSGVYLRAFVRSYAEVVGISPEVAAEHLKAAREEAYDGELATRYLEGSARDQESIPSFEIEDAPSSRSTQNQDTSSGESDNASARRWAKHPSGLSAGEASDSAGRFNTESPPTGPGIPSEGPAKASQSQTSGLFQSASRRGPSLRTPIDSVLQFLRRISWGMVEAILLLGMIGAYAYGYFGSPENVTNTSDRLESRPVTEDIAPSADSLSTEPGVFGDTLHLTILATSKVQAMRVMRDQDLRRPYWIEVDSAKVFPFTRRIALERELDDARLFLEGYPYPTTRTDQSGRVVIDQNAADSFADTITGAPLEISPRPDTIAFRSP